MEMKSFTKSATFAAAASASTIVDIEDAKWIGIFMGSTWKSNAPITFLGAVDASGDYQSIRIDTGVEAVVASVSPSISIAMIGNNLNAVIPWRYIKLQSGYTASVIAQPAATTIKLALKRE